MRRISSGLTFTLVALTVSFQTAVAAATTLVCTNPYQPNNVPFTIDLDQIQSTVHDQQSRQLDQIQGDIRRQENHV
jgi:hypothetical protein